MANRPEEEERRGTPPGETDADTGCLFQLIDEQTYLQLSELGRQHMRDWLAQVVVDGNNLVGQLLAGRDQEVLEQQYPAYQYPDPQSQQFHHPSPAQFQQTQQTQSFGYEQPPPMTYDQPFDPMLDAGTDHRYPYGLADYNTQPQPAEAPGYNGPSQHDQAPGYGSYHAPAPSGPPAAAYGQLLQGITAPAGHEQPQAHMAPGATRTRAEHAPVAAAAAAELWNNQHYGRRGSNAVPDLTDAPPWPGKSAQAPPRPDGPFIRAVLAPGTSTGSMQFAKCTRCKKGRRTCQAHYVWPCADCTRHSCEVGNDVHFVAVEYDEHGFDLGQGYMVREVSQATADGEGLRGQMQQQQQQQQQ